MNHITDLLNLEDSSIIVTDVSIKDMTKFISLDIPVTPHFCPLCNFRMHSKGIFQRSITHPVLQDGYQLVLLLRQRRWKCTNPQCRYSMNDSFRFVDKNRRVTNTTDLLIIEAYKDLSVTSADLADRFNVSDTYVHEVFNRYVKMKRLPLSDIISVDEVHLELDDRCKYALVIQDFYSGEPIDLLSSRREEATEPYFSSIPFSERKHVRYLISDMYNNYIDYVSKYFPNAVAVVDSFHVIQWVVRKIDQYIRALINKFKDRDREEYQKNHPYSTFEKPSIPISNEVYLLKNFKWLILANQSSIHYKNGLTMDRHFHCLMNTYDYEDRLFMIDPKLREFRDLKELYVSFNARNAGNPYQAGIELEDLIDHYRKSKHVIFREFAELLMKYKEEIINSFVVVEKYGPGGIYNSRLSNGPIESLNRKVKDLKRLGRGYRNFEHFRNRFLYATRNNPVLDLTKNAQVHYYVND